MKTYLVRPNWYGWGLFAYATRISRNAQLVPDKLKQVFHVEKAPKRMATPRNTMAKSVEPDLVGLIEILILDSYRKLLQNGLLASNFVQLLQKRVNVVLVDRCT